MSLNPKLPPQVIAQLYPNTLVQLNQIHEVQKVTHAKTPAGDLGIPSVKYLGENRKHITLLIYNQNLAFLEDNELEQLIKILQACHLSLLDVAIVNLAHTHPLEPRQIMLQTEATQAIIFIPQPDILGLESHVPLYEIIHVAEVECTFSEPLEKIIGSQDVKKKLWRALKSLFKLPTS
ncbi:MAG: hypothetical protein KF880_04835 [Ferruginibacter sp.]|nr:hypothetical protein [Ferruginibacter sp.]